MKPTMPSHLSSFTHFAAAALIAVGSVSSFAATDAAKPEAKTEAKVEAKAPTKPDLVKGEASTQNTWLNSSKSSRLVHAITP